MKYNFCKICNKSIDLSKGGVQEMKKRGGVAVDITMLLIYSCQEC